MGPIMLIHIVTASAALISGAAALTLRKGGRGHAQAGTIFFASMLAMASTGALIAFLKPERTTAIIGVTTCYLVATAWWAARRRDGKPGRFEQTALLVALACTAGQFALGLWAMQDPRGKFDLLPYQVNFAFGSLVGLAAVFDIRFLMLGQLSGRQRLGRHLWRMTTAMLIATTSFFQGQQKNFPEAWQGSAVWYLPPLAVLAAMIFWGVRVRFAKSYGYLRPRPTPAPALAPEAA